MKAKFFIYSLAVLIIIVISACGFYYYGYNAHKADVLRIQFAYPVTSIDPIIYDDWESSFIGNHIYYRLLPQENRPWVPYVTDRLSINCYQPESKGITDACKIIKITFTPISFRD